MKTKTANMISFTEIHHLAWLNWEQDGCPQGLDMEYLFAAESLLVANGIETAGHPKSVSIIAGPKPSPTRSASKRPVRACPGQSAKQIALHAVPQTLVSTKRAAV